MQSTQTQLRCLHPSSQSLPKMVSRKRWPLEQIWNELALRAHPPPTQPPNLAQQAIDQVFQATIATAPARGRLDPGPVMPQHLGFNSVPR